MRIRGICTVPGCGRPHLAKGLCSAHYKRTKKSRKGVEPDRAIGDITGQNNPRYKGFHARKDGYVLVKAPGHPMAHKSGYVLRHRLVMARRLGRMLTPQEVVHHNGEQKDDRDIGLLPSNSAHIRLHHREDPPPRDERGRIQKRVKRTITL